jgi:hypothetical protein
MLTISEGDSREVWVEPLLTGEHTRVEYTWSLSASRPAPFAPSRYEYGFAGPGDEAAIAALVTADAIAARGGTSSVGAIADQTISDVRQSLAIGEDEWIVARHGRAIVAAVRVRAHLRVGAHLQAAPSVDPAHRQCGLERYLAHLALVWLRAMGVMVALASTAPTERAMYEGLGGRRSGAALPGSHADAAMPTRAAA